MAPTPEQIKNLKPGDPIVIHTTIDQVDSDGDVRFLSPNSCGDDNHAYINLEYVSLPGEPVEQPKPKYDPRRLFKKGDKVQPRSGKTVLASEYGYVTFHELAGEYEVNEDEARGTVTLIVNGHACFVSAFALKLVTPVEELEPYSIYPANTNVLFKCGKKFATFEDDDEAQEMCDRLNEEWRKEQK